MSSLLGGYQLLEWLGQSGRVITFRAVHLSSGREVLAHGFLPGLPQGQTDRRSTGVVTCDFQPGSEDFEHIKEEMRGLGSVPPWTLIGAGSHSDDGNATRYLITSLPRELEDLQRWLSELPSPAGPGTSTAEVAPGASGSGGSVTDMFFPHAGSTAQEVPARPKSAIRRTDDLPPSLRPAALAEPDSHAMPTPFPSPSRETPVESGPGFTAMFSSAAEAAARDQPRRGHASSGAPSESADEMQGVTRFLASLPPLDPSRRSPGGAFAAYSSIASANTPDTLAPNPPKPAESPFSGDETRQFEAKFLGLPQNEVLAQELAHVAGAVPHVFETPDLLAAQPKAAIEEMRSFTPNPGGFTEWFAVGGGAPQPKPPIAYEASPLFSPGRIDSGGDTDRFKIPIGVPPRTSFRLGGAAGGRIQDDWATAQPNGRPAPLPIAQTPVVSETMPSVDDILRFTSDGVRPEQPSSGPSAPQGTLLFAAADRPDQPEASPQSEPSDYTQFMCREQARNADRPALVGMKSIASGGEPVGNQSTGSFSRFQHGLPTEPSWLSPPSAPAASSSGSAGAVNVSAQLPQLRSAYAPHTPTVSPPTLTMPLGGGKAAKASGKPSYLPFILILNGLFVIAVLVVLFFLLKKH